MLIDHFKKTHYMKVGSTLRFTREDLILKLFFEGPITHPSGIQASIPSSISSTMVPSLAKVKAQIESGIDSMGLEDCVENIYKDVF